MHRKSNVNNISCQYIKMLIAKYFAAAMLLFSLPDTVFARSGTVYLTEDFERDCECDFIMLFP